MRPVESKMLKKPDESDSSQRSSDQLMSGFSTTDPGVVERAASSPLDPERLMPPKIELKAQLSAPSYWYSLRDAAPPFYRPGKEMKPGLLFGTVMRDVEAVDMIEEACGENGLKNYLIEFLIEKKIVANDAIRERNFLISLVAEAIDYAARKDFSAVKLACLITIYLKTHVYFKWHYLVQPTSVWAYFKEIMIRHTIEDAPDGQEIFSPAECYDILSHFHTVYMSNLPLVHLLTFGAYRLKFVWPFRSHGGSVSAAASPATSGSIK